jgi:hypothetical protein
MPTPSSFPTHPVLVRFACAALLVLGLAADATAHDLGKIQVYGSFHRGGTYQIDLVMDEEHLKMAELGGPGRPTRYGVIEGLSGETATRMGRFLSDLADATTLRFDGEIAEPRVSIAPPEPGSSPRPGRAVLRLTGEIPSGVHSVGWQVAMPLGRYPLVLRNEGDDLAMWQWVENSQAGPPFRLAPGIAPPPAPSGWRVLLAGLGTGLTRVQEHLAEVIVLALGLLLSARGLRFQTAQLGLLGAGLLAGGLVLAARPGSLAPQAAGIALALTALALSNLVPSRGGGRSREWAWILTRSVLVVGTGVIVGLSGGAVPPHGHGVLRRLAETTGVAAGFALGVAAATAVAFLLLGVSYRRQSWYRERVVLPASAMAAAAALYWTAQQLL